jgi:hypothetical protein
MAAILGWTQAPALSSTWVQLTASPDEIAQVEQSAYFANCSHARAAGAAPIYRGSPGYRSGMDGDDDGVACEPYRGMPL